MVKPIVFLFFLLFFSAGWAQEFVVTPERIEYIDPDSHQLASVQENTLDFTSVKLSRDTNYLAVYLPKQDHNHESHTEYYYKLTQNNESYDWFSCGHEVRLVGLALGKHRLCIMAQNPEGMASANMFNLDIEVPPSIWFTPWFTALVALFVIFVLILWRSYEYRIFKIRTDRDLQISHLEARAYRAQMNPHFIFNALNGMQTAMILR